MSIKTEKIHTISGDEVEILETICVLAGRYIDKQKTMMEKEAKKDTLYVDEYFYETIRKAQELIRAIWGT